MYDDWQISYDRRFAEIARELDLPAEEVRQIFWAIVGMTRRVQQEKRGS